MENLMDETVDGWHEMENKEKVVVRMRHVRMLGYEGWWRNCTGGDLLKARPYEDLLNQIGLATISQ